MHRYIVSTLERGNDIKRQVKDAYRGVISNISRVTALKATVTSATSALEATEAGFGAGTRTMVDVLNEQRNLYRAKRDFTRTRYDCLINSIKLKQAASSLSQDDLERLTGCWWRIPGAKSLGKNIVENIWGTGDIAMMLFIYSLQTIQNSHATNPLHQKSSKRNGA